MGQQQRTSLCVLCGKRLAAPLENNGYALIYVVKNLPRLLENNEQNKLCGKKSLSLS